MKYALSHAASQDIATIARWIAQDDPVRAVSFARELLESCRSLTMLPLGYPTVQLDATPPVRRKNHDKYAIFFRVTQDRVLVIAVLHGARDVMSILRTRLG